MATGVQTLTLEEFRRRYAGRKPYYEYWFGEAVQKTAGTWLHSVLQAIAAELLRAAGYEAATELELKIDPQWAPVPDVVGSLKSIAGPYPTEAVDVVIEIFSPDDRMSYVIAKCQNYARIGVPQVFVLDPEAKLGWQWVNGSLESMSDLKLNNGSVIALNEVWRRLGRDA